MEFRQIRYFLEICRHRSFGKAASGMGLTQPALSRQIALLEKEMDCLLFDRSARQVRLTSAGLKFQEQAVRMEDLWKETRSVLTTQESSKGEFSLCSGGTVAAWVLPPILAKIRIKTPGISFRLLEGDAQQTLQWVLDAEVDLGILSGPVNASGLDQKFFFSDRIVPVISTQHPLARLKKPSLAEILEQDFVLFHPASAIRQILEKKWKSTRLKRPLKSAMELRGVESVLRCVEAGLGIGFTSELAVSPRLKILPVEELTAERKFYFCYRSARKQGIESFIGKMEEYSKIKTGTK